MDILKLIKNRRTIRKYKNKPIPKRILDKIIEAGRWGPSIAGKQPWKLVVITDRIRINRISKILQAKSKTKQLDIGARFIFKTSLIALNNTKLLIAVYNTGSFAKKAKEIQHYYFEFAKEAENSAISATIQNMILVAESLEVGSCWLHTPVFCEKEINRVLKIKDNLVGVISFGFPAEQGYRSPRNHINETVIYI